MITSFFDSGKGAGSGIYYLTDKREPEAQVLRGDIDAQVQLIDSLDFKQRYLSGVHRFIEPDLADETKNEIMDSFENMMFAGLSEEQKPPVLWVQHQEKGGTELHFIIPEVNMESGKKFTPFWHETDLKLVDAWKDTINYEYGLTDPNEPERAQTLTIPKSLPRNRQDALKKLDDTITNMAVEGVINNRAEMVIALKEAGLEVTRQGKNYISIKAEGWNKPARLKGVLYGKNFRGIGELREEIEQKSIEYREGAGKRYQSALERYTKELEKRGKRIRKKHKKHNKNNRKEAKQTYSLNTTLEYTLDDVRGVVSIKSGADVLRTYNNGWNNRGAAEAATDRKNGRKNRPNAMQNQQWAETLREGSSNTSIQRWLQAFKVKVGEINDRTRETLTGWYRAIDEKLRETNHQIERTNALATSTSSRLGSANRNLAETIKLNERANIKIEVMQLPRRSRGRDNSQDLSR